MDNAGRQQPRLLSLAKNQTDRELQTAKDTITQNDDPKPSNAALRRLAQTGYIFSKSEAAKTVTRLLNERPEAAVPYVVAETLRVANDIGEWTRSRDSATEGGLNAMVSGLWEIISTLSPGKDHRKLIDDLTADHNEAISVLGEDHNNAVEDRKAMAEIAANQIEEIEAKGNDLKSQFAKLIMDFNATAVGIKNDYEKLLRLEAPKSYWAGKTDRHTWTAWIACGVFLLTLGAGLWGLYYEILPLVVDASKDLVPDQGTDISNRGTEIKSLYPFVLITIPVLALAWVLRHISRIIVQNFALAEDARLRATIAETYLAVTRGRGEESNETMLVLTALFRPFDSSGHTEISPLHTEDVLRAIRQK